MDAIYSMFAFLTVKAFGLYERAKDPRGQGTVEYVGVVLLLAVLLAAVVGVSSKAGKDLPETIVKKITQALNKIK